MSVRTSAAPRAVGRTHRRPVEQASPAARVQQRGDGAVVRLGRARLPSSPAGRCAVRARLGGRGGDGVRQPRPSLVRQRAGRGRKRRQRGLAERRPDDRLTRHRRRPRRPADRHCRLRVGVRRRRRLVRRGARRLVADRRLGVAARADRGARARSGPRRSAVRPQRAGAVGLARDDGDRAHIDVQLLGRLPAVREADLARQRHRLHPAVRNGCASDPYSLRW